MPFEAPARPGRTYGSLRYEDFSVRMSVGDIPRLHELLSAISEREHARLRAGVARYASAFVWGEGGLAYEHVRYELCLRSGLPCGHLRPHHPHVGPRA